MPERTWDTPWEVEDGWAALAEYTSIASLPAELRPAPEASLVGEAVAAATPRIARHLYEQIAEQHWSYVHAPRSDRGQLLRDPDTIRAGHAATCLDVALLYATMAKAAGLLPRLAVLDNDISRHAVVLIPTTQRPNWVQPVHEWAIPYPNWDNYLAVDVTTALIDTQRPSPGTWVESLRAGSAHFQQGSDYDSCHVIDIVASNATHPEVKAVDTDAPRPAIYQMLPSLGAPIELNPWQKDAVGDALALAVGGGCLVIAGPSGMGKTAAALRPAYRVAHGSGWLLNATDETTLRRSFAQAEVATRPRFADIAASGLFAQALARLATTTFPWVVILDGADHPDGPKHYAGLIPTPTAGQLVVITTTKVEKWETWRSWDRESHKIIVVPPDAPSPLVAALGGNETDGVDDVGRLVAARVAALDTSTAEMARVLGWTPPLSAPIPEDMSEREAAETYRALVEAGLVDSSSRIMHRKVREAVLAGEAGQPDNRLLIRMIRVYPRAFAAVADSSNRHNLIAKLSDASDPEMADSGMLAIADALTRDETQAAAGIYSKLLARMGWSLTGWVAADDTQAIRARKCLEGVARWKFRQKVPAAALEASELVQAGLRIPVPTQDRSLSEQQDLRLRALQLLARRVQITDSADPPEKKRAAYQALIADFDVSYQRRQELVPGHLDVARARFNLPGTRVRLAQLLPDNEAVAQYREALSEYEAVYEFRRQAFGTDDLDDVAACLHGQAIALYYLSLHDVSLTVRERNQYLGRAAQLASRAMASRQISLWGSNGVGAVVRESAALLHKIVLTVLQVHQAKLGGKGPDASFIEQSLETSALINRLVSGEEDAG
ncbi:MAG: hypothetical protein ACOYEV_16310 [Candidatus Nanopelagicales bacterium]